MRYRSSYRSRSSRSRYQESLTSDQSRAIEHVRQHEELRRSLGPIVADVETKFFSLSPRDLYYLWNRYQANYGWAARLYAVETYPKWKSGRVKLSGQTATRLLHLVPRYLTPQERFDMVERLCKHHAPCHIYVHVDIDLAQPSQGWAALENAIDRVSEVPSIKHLPPHVPDTVKWLNDGETIAARKMLAAVDEVLNRTRLSFARTEVARLQQLISQNQCLDGHHDIVLVGGTVHVTFRKLPWWKRFF